MNKHDFDQLQITWKNFGNSEPFWSVLTQEQYKFHNINDNNSKEFYQTGEDTIEFFENILQKYNYSFKNKIVLDFGCGVGRLTKPLTHLASKVYGMDISETHLNYAKQQDKITEFFLVDNFETLPEVPFKPNIILSLIVLQHSRPQLIAHYINLLINSLEKDGIALLHIPYNIPNYHEVDNQVDVMEMHFLPKFMVQTIVKLNDCIILDKVETNFCGGDIKDCVYVIKKL